MSKIPKGFHLFLLLKLPAAFFCGVRLKLMNDTTCITSVRHRWINQNPFNSMFWAVQGMAAELSTGAMFVTSIRAQKEKISMLVANNKASFHKKATGRITFTCKDGHLVQEAILQTLATGEGQTLWMHSEGRNTEGDLVSTFSFEWTIKVKKMNQIFV